MDDNDIYIPAEIPKPRWRDQWAETVALLGGPIVAYPLTVSVLISAIWGIVDVVAWFLN